VRFGFRVVKLFLPLTFRENKPRSHALSHRKMDQKVQKNKLFSAKCPSYMFFMNEVSKVHFEPEVVVFVFLRMCSDKK